MNDTHVIHYQTDRHVSVAHGPLTADTYLSGTNEALRKDVEPPFWRRWWDKPRAPDPYDYERQRWRVLREIADAEGVFRCKHGALPDSGERGEDALRYFGRHDRFSSPFARGAEGAASPVPWAAWSFNATRRKCVHEAVNSILSMAPSDERTDLTRSFTTMCSMC